MSKLHKSVNQQISILKNRGMHFKSILDAKQTLYKNNYYNLINGYKNFIIDESSKDRKYIPNLYFEEVVEIYQFDKALKSLFLSYILHIEDEFRCHISYEFSKNHGAENWDDINSFECFSQKSKNYALVLINKLKQFILKTSKDSHDDMINHFSSKNEKVPIWALVNTFDFGTEKYFYFNMKSHEKDFIARNYYSLKYSQLKSFLETLNMYRNVCAHGFRLLFYRINDKDKQISSMPIHKNMKIELIKRNNSQTIYKYGKNDLFSVVIIFKYMLSKEMFNWFFTELNKIVSKLKKKIKVIDINKIFNSIGFPIKNSSNQLNWDYIIKTKK